MTKDQHNIMNAGIDLRNMRKRLAARPAWVKRASLAIPANERTDGGSRSYVVRQNVNAKDEWMCDCLAWVLDGGTCKHIATVKKGMAR